MAQKNREKDIWLIPKRVNLHQTICLIDGIIDRNYNGTSWNPQKQNNLGVNLKKWGATRDGKNISPQAIRTLVASIPQYLGFIYINTNTTPNTICITDIGYKLWKEHIHDIKKIPNLIEGSEETIKESEIVLQQLEKLIITNPIILKDCDNILIFPFRFMLKVLLKIGFLDQEEIAYFLFKVRSEDEFDLVINEISNFRILEKSERIKLIDSFKKTHIGNITLVKAASSGYYISLCLISGILEKFQARPVNSNKSISAIKIKNNFIQIAENIVYKKYDNIEPYNFNDNLPLWIDYIGNPNHLFPPENVKVMNSLNEDFLITIEYNDRCIFNDIINNHNYIICPMFADEKYTICLYDIAYGKCIYKDAFIPKHGIKVFEPKIDIKYINDNDDFVDYVKLIQEHCNAKNFSKNYTNRLNIIAKLSGVDKTRDKNLRGAYLEFLFYNLLLQLEQEKIIDDVVWNGKIGKFGLPVSAPGGKLGTPDIIFKIDGYSFVLELTTIQSKSMQFSAEGSSAPDHIKLYKKENNGNVIGIFCAPIQHQRNITIMQAAIASSGIKLNCLTVNELLNILIIKNRDFIIKQLV